MAKRLLSKEEKELCKKSIQRLQREKKWAEFDIQILELKLSEWKILKSKLKYNINKGIQKTEYQIEQLQKQLKEFKDMKESNYQINKNLLKDELKQLQKFIERDCDNQIKILQNQIQFGVEEKTKKEEQK